MFHRIARRQRSRYHAEYAVPRRVLAGFLACLAMPAAASPALPAPPPLERNHYQRISTSAEISADLAGLADASGLARRETLGHSRQGRALEALILGDPDADARTRVLIVGSQHGASEPVPAEALLAIARRILWGDLRALLGELQLILIPNANPDGRDLGRRANAAGVNINTDFVRAREPETQALLQALTRYEPHAVVDSHESAVLKRKSLGATGWLTDFEMQYECANHPAVSPPLAALCTDILMPALLQAASLRGYQANRYIGEITRLGQPITNGGFSLRNFRNASGVQHRLSLLLETRLDSSEGQYPSWQNVVQRQARQAHALEDILWTLRDQRKLLLQRVGTPPSGPFPLSADYVRDRAQPWIDIRLRRRDNGALVWHRFPNHREVASGPQIIPPDAYLIATEQPWLRPVLDAHGIAYEQLPAPRRLFPAADSEASSLLAPAGSLLVDLNQRRGRHAVLLLDTRSRDGLFQYPEFAALLAGNKPPPALPVQLSPARPKANR